MTRTKLVRELVPGDVMIRSGTYERVHRSEQARSIYAELAGFWRIGSLAWSHKTQEWIDKRLDRCLVGNLTVEVLTPEYEDLMFGGRDGAADQQPSVG